LRPAEGRVQICHYDSLDSGVIEHKVPQDDGMIFYGVDEVPDCLFSSAAVTFPRASAHWSGAATQLGKMPENILSDSVHSSKSLRTRILGQLLVLGGILSGNSYVGA